MDYFDWQRLANEIRAFSLHLAEQQPTDKEPRFLSAVLNEDGETDSAYFKVKDWPHRYKKPLTGTIDDIKNELIRLTIHMPESDELEPIRPLKSHPQDVWDFVEREFGIKRESD